MSSLGVIKICTFLSIAIFISKSSLYYGYNPTPLKRFAEKSDTNYETISLKKWYPETICSEKWHPETICSEKWHSKTITEKSDTLRV